ncbi:MAG TPA: Ni/Fe hydrogenase subunit alpha [Blastocatellia bacterium]|nr:Ni/Fe hydrogenase subunit alpha [Blastocatellia bacterium]
MTEKRSRKIRVEALARVEGEGAMHVQVRDGKVTDVRLEIYEPPRFFEAFLRGRDFREVPDITARICGICPVAYQMSAVHAMERAIGITVDGELRELRRLLYCGEWIESHVLHIYMLHAPDFLGFQDAIAMAKVAPELVQRGLALKKLGNEIVTVIGGREIHPINVRVGGFYKSPAKAPIKELLEKLKGARQAALDTVAWVATFDFPEFERDCEFVSLRHPDEYPFCEGRIVSSAGLDISVDEYRDTFVEEHVAHSNALHSKIRARGAFFVGPQARYSLNFDRLPQVAQDAARAAGLGTECRNPFKSIIVRAVELVFAVEEAIRICETYEPPMPAAVPAEPRAGVGCGASEAPRGLLFHRYQVAADGSIEDAVIIPPTSQNQKSVEEDLRDFAQMSLHLDNAELQWKCEQAIRNYDPCISCATHFLKLTVDRQ